MASSPKAEPFGPPKDELFGHPKGLFVLFFAEMWERFSFYGMRGILVLYMVEALKYGDELAQGTYAAYIGFVYATPFVGGMLADRLLGARKAIVLGGILMSFGHFIMAIENTTFFYAAMALIIAGNGFFKPNISTMVGSLYDKSDPRRDGAFTIFYMGINVGAFAAPLACGYLGEKVGWHWGFGLAGIGMVAGLLVFVWGQKYIGDFGLPPRPEALREKTPLGVSKTTAIYLGVVAFVPVAAYLLIHPNVVETGVIRVIGPLVLLYMMYVIARCDRQERGRIIVLMVLIFFSITFWACFEQAGSSMTLFAKRLTDLHVLGWEVPVSWLQAINPGFIILLGIPFSMLWSKLGRAGRDPSSPLKFSLGLIQLGAGFVAMVFAAQQASSGEKASILWLVLAYFLHTTGELCLSPVGLSTITRMSPTRLVGLMMGLWFMSNAFAGVLSGVIAKATSGEAGYEEVFRMVVYFGIGSGVLLLLITPLLNKLGPDPKYQKQQP